MSTQTEVHFCKNCHKETTHILLLIRKKSPFENSKHRKIKEFIHGYIKAWWFGTFLAAMDDFNRHLICEECGETIIDE
jgi:protein-arginine kinase activator protein McsA